MRITYIPYLHAIHDSSTAVLLMDFSNQVKYMSISQFTIDIKSYQTNELAD